MKNNKNKIRLDGKKKLVAFTKTMETDMHSFLRDKNIESESELIRQAVGNYIYSDYTDETLKLQGMKKIQTQIEENRDMIDIIFKFLEKIHINLLAYLPELDPQVVDSAFLSATHRNDKVIKSLRGSLKNDPPFFERLLSTYYTEAAGAKEADDGKV